jgi:hypothetical protein
VRPESRQLAFDEVVQRNAASCTGSHEVARERMQSAGDACFRVLERRAVIDAAAHERLHNGQHVLSAVLQLTNEHELARFRMLALSDIPRDGVNGGWFPVRIWLACLEISLARPPGNFCSTTTQLIACAMGLLC